MTNQLDDRKVAILIANGVEQVELEEPMRALEEAGAVPTIVSPAGDWVRAWRHDHWGQDFEVDVALADADGDQFDALLLPGGVMNPDYLRLEPKAAEFVKAFFDQGKPVAAICHGPWMLAEADVLRGRRMTSYPSIKTDMKNAGAEWVDEEVVVDQRLVTSRSPKDLDAFCAKMIEVFGEGRRVAKAA